MLINLDIIYSSFFAQISFKRDRVAGTKKKKKKTPFKHKFHRKRAIIVGGRNKNP
jgi:hypothetical protein